MLYKVQIFFVQILKHFLNLLSIWFLLQLLT